MLLNAVRSLRPTRHVYTYIHVPTACINNIYIYMYIKIDMYIIMLARVLILLLTEMDLNIHVHKDTWTLLVRRQLLPLARVSRQPWRATAIVPAVG